MKYLIVTLTGATAIHGSQHIGSLFPGYPITTCVLAFIFLVCLLCVTCALILNRRCTSPKIPTYIIPPNSNQSKLQTPKS